MTDVTTAKTATVPGSIRSDVASRGPRRATPSGSRRNPPLEAPIWNIVIDHGNYGIAM